MDESLIEPLAPWLTVWIGVLGLLVGSFLNVVIARVPEGLSIVRPRSRCPNCGHQLAWYENIPVFSWLFLRGRCKGCKAPISPRYVLVELLTCALYLACVRRFGFTYELLPALVMVSLVIPLTFIDLEHWLLPWSLTLPGIVLGIALSIPMGTERLIESAIGAGAGFVAFLLLEIVGEKIFKKEALGGGDKYLLAMLGGFLTWRFLLGIIFLSSLQGALIGSLLLLIRGRAGPAPESVEGGAKQETDTAASKPKHEPSTDEEEEDDWEPGATSIPFGPWLSIAALELLLIGPWLGTVLPGTLKWLATGQLEY